MYLFAGGGGGGVVEEGRNRVDEVVVIRGRGGAVGVHPVAFGGGSGAGAEGTGLSDSPSVGVKGIEGRRDKGKEGASRLFPLHHAPRIMHQSTGGGDRWSLSPFAALLRG